MPKKRIQIPEEIAVSVRYESDNTCCCCNDQSKTIQIHHIDDNPSNNSEENLAILCLECHNKTQVTGGFGRRLDATMVKKCKNEWTLRVKQRREHADQLASLNLPTTNTIVQEPFSSEDEDIEGDSYKLKLYLAKAYKMRRVVYEASQKLFDTGITAHMNQGASDIIDFYESVLVNLAEFYPYEHFDHKEAKIFFNDLVRSRFRLYYAITCMDPEDHGSETYTMVAGDVMGDLERLIKSVVFTLCSYHPIEYSLWEKAWDDADK